MAEKCVKEANETKIKDKIIEVCIFKQKNQREDARKNLYAKNLPPLPEAELEKKLRDTFGKYGEISSMVVKL